jgi:hypothetical protein
MKKNLSLFLISACGLILVTGCQSTATTNPRSNLLRSINGANVDGYAFSFDEDATRSAASFTSPAVTGVITLAPGDAGVPLRYTTISDKATNTATTYKTEIVRHGSAVSYVITDLTTNREVQRTSVDDDDVPPPPDADACAQSPSCAVFFHDYECNEKPRLQCEANSTCKIVHGHFRCRQPNGSCIDGPTVVTPNTFSCVLRETMVDIDRLVLRRP